MKRKNLSPSVRDYHSLHWLLYAYLQQGRNDDAEKLLNLMKKVMAQSTYDNKLRPGYYENNYANMAAAFVVETERWDLANELFPENKPASTSEQATMSGSHASHNAMASGNGSATLRTSSASVMLPLFVRGLAAAMNGSAAAVEQSIAGLQAIRSGRNSTTSEIFELEISALSASMKKDHAKAIELMKKATSLEESMSVRRMVRRDSLSHRTSSLARSCCVQESLLRPPSSSGSHCNDNQTARARYSAPRAPPNSSTQKAQNNKRHKKH
jgi:hypothetical protein